MTPSGRVFERPTADVMNKHTNQWGKARGMMYPWLEHWVQDDNDNETFNGYTRRAVAVVYSGRRKGGASRALPQL